MGSEQADDAGPLRVQNIPVVVSDHLVQLQDPALGRGRGEIERSEQMKRLMERNQDGGGGWAERQKSLAQDTHLLP